ncbi:hypothetical protein DTO96_100223 [Ephemeroptericola cinctiostellae]|uniref:Uncharacterized protein n=1 Tax=Ephemeroptericola cinctiostellae TaxID=2268024 RepID=A0A345D827_9BURK|nr:hypothetical protein DTO96_100223 [Ephemeroptericola cinctiostellae]
MSVGSVACHFEKTILQVFKFSECLNVAGACGAYTQCQPQKIKSTKLQIYIERNPHYQSRLIAASCSANGLR